MTTSWRPHPSDWRWRPASHNSPTSIQVIEPPAQAKPSGPFQAFGFGRELAPPWDGRCHGTTKAGKRCRVKVAWPAYHCRRHR